MAKKRSLNNEKGLERELQRFFKRLLEEVQLNLDTYWSDYNLLQGQVLLITAPIQEHHQDYYDILARYNKKEYKLGEAEAERLVKLAIGRYSNKGIRENLKAKLRNKKDLFGTILWSEEDLLNKVFIASQGTLARVTSDINQVITEGYTSGKGINVVANMITRRFNGLTDWEAKRIARTEIHNSHNQGVMRIYDTMNVTYTQWISAGDDGRTRESHLEVDGEIIPIGEKYSNGLRYPGDTSGPIEEWINCRCSNAPFVVPYGYMAPEHYPFREEDLVKI